MGKFVQSARQAQAPAGHTVPTTVTDQLNALHLQCKTSARQETKFKLAKKPKAWLSWADCQRTRANAQRKLAKYTGKSITKRRQLVKDVCFLTLVRPFPDQCTALPFPKFQCRDV